MINDIQIVFEELCKLTGADIDKYQNILGTRYKNLKNKGAKDSEIVEMLKYLINYPESNYFPSWKAFKDAMQKAQSYKKHRKIDISEVPMICKWCYFSSSVRTDNTELKNYCLEKREAGAFIVGQESCINFLWYEDQDGIDVWQEKQREQTRKEKSEQIAQAEVKRIAKSYEM